MSSLITPQASPQTLKEQLADQEFPWELSQGISLHLCNFFVLLMMKKCTCYCIHCQTHKKRLIHHNSNHKLFFFKLASSKISFSQHICKCASSEIFRYQVQPSFVPLITEMIVIKDNYLLFSAPHGVVLKNLCFLRQDVTLRADVSELKEILINHYLIILRHQSDYKKQTSQLRKIHCCRVASYCLLS